MIMSSLGRKYDTDFIEKIRRTLSKINSSEDDSRLEGLLSLKSTLDGSDKKFEDSGYDLVIFKELVKLVGFESDKTLETSLAILESHFVSDKRFHDQLVETLAFRVARSNDREVSSSCLRVLSKLIDHMDTSIAKHSQQILKLVDMNDCIHLNSIMIDILKQLESKLPPRLSI